MGSRVVFWAALTVAIGVALAVHLLDFPGSVPDFVRASGGGTLLDATPAFTADGVYWRLDGYGGEGRKNYAFRNATVDVLLPFSVLPFLVLLSRRADARLGRYRVATAVMLAVPFVYVAFDLVENGIVLALLQRHPDRLPALAFSLPYVTMVKRLASLLALLLPLGVLVLRAWIRPAAPPSTK